MIDLEMIDLEMIDLEMIGLEMIDLEMIGFEMIDLEMIVYCLMFFLTLQCHLPNGSILKNQFISIADQDKFLLQKLFLDKCFHYHNEQ